MTLTIACHTASAFERAGYDAAVNHEQCQRKGGVAYQLPDGFGVVAVKPCGCECHAEQDRSWMPIEPKRWWQKRANGTVRLAL